MKFSLLKKTDDCSAVCDIIYDLSVDRAVYNLIYDKRRADYFLSVLSTPLTKKENIIYRQEIFSDFKNIDGLFESLNKIFTRYDKIKSDWHEMKPVNSSHFKSESEINPEALLNYTFSSLKVTALFPSTLASFFLTIGETLQSYPIKSEALISIRDWCIQMSENKALSELVEISQLFRYNSPEDFDFTVVTELDNALRVVKCDISDISEVKSETVFGKLFSKKKHENEIHVESKLSKAGEDPYSDSLKMLNNALIRIDSVLAKTTFEVYEAFFGISKEMMFYEAALIYAGIAESNNVALAIPKILEAKEDKINIIGIKDLLLLSNGNGLKLVDNDVILEKNIDGFVVKGITDSGKTVFLRSIGVAQLFAQSGIPVLAKSAEVSIRKGFFSHFSSAEEDFIKGDAMGRFDKEAKEISKIIEQLQPHSLLLLNETFQTTSYKEGTEGIYNILRFMPKLKTKYVFVTHLTHLFEYMKEEQVVLAHTSEDENSKYKIIV